MIVINWIIFSLTVVSSSLILASHNWRWNLVFLAVQYACLFWWVQISWGASLAIVKLVTGWMICAVLGIAHLNNHGEDTVETTWPQGRLFRFMVIGMILVITFLGARGLQDWLGLILPAAWGGVLLIGMGLLLAGITLHPFRVILGLLTFLSGFEILYAAMENSSLVTGLLALVNLGLALAGAYFLGNEPERQEE